MFWLNIFEDLGPEATSVLFDFFILIFMATSYMNKQQYDNILHAMSMKYGSETAKEY